ncbi:MAG: hypothetical protein JRN59_07365 [Nitrososphaerota archaeon]|nr:hypothetical protein [Nitrososphaerota archaeon]
MDRLRAFARNSNWDLQDRVFRYLVEHGPASGYEICKRSAANLSRSNWANVKEELEYFEDIEQREDGKWWLTLHGVEAAFTAVPDIKKLIFEAAKYYTEGELRPILERKLRRVRSEHDDIVEALKVLRSK